MDREYIVKQVAIVLILSLITVVPNGLITNGTSNHLSIQDTYSNVGDLLIEDIVGSSFNAIVDYSGPKDSIRNDRHWQKRWMTSDHSLIEIEYNPISLEVFSVILPNSWKRIQVGMNTHSKESILSSARAYLEYCGYFSFPEDAVLKHVRHDSIGWVVEWMHIVEGVVVKDDYCRVILNSDGTHIFSFSKQWDEITIPIISDILKEDAFQAIKNTMGTRFHEMNPTASLEIVNVGTNHILVWIVMTDTSEYWVDARTSEVLHIVDTLTITGNKDVFVYDTGDQTSYNTADHIYDRIKTAQSFSSGGSAHYYEDKSIQFISGALVMEEAFYNVGHGYGAEEGDKWYTGIATTTGLMLARHLPSDLSTIKLAFLCSCYSYATQYWLGGDTYVPVEKNICQGFLDKGAECVFGWKKSINKDQAQIFSIYFYDCMVNGYNFQSCFNYAYSKVNSYTQARAQIGGDTSLYLEKDDLPGNTMSNALYLGSGPGSNPQVGKWYYNLEEGLWGCKSHSYTDTDWYSVYLTQQYTTVELWVNPLIFYGRLDAVIEVYNSVGSRIIYKNLCGTNIGESCWWEGSGWYYIKVTHALTYTHGGSYDLSMHVFMIS